MRSRAPVFTLRNGMITLVLALLGIWIWVGLSTCRSDRVSVNPKDPQSPQFAYRQDELALLSLMADDIQQLERKKQYATIYDDYTSQDFKNSTSRRRFLIIANCVETYLGGMDSDGYDPHDLGFRRESLKGSGSHSLDVLNRKVHRMMGVIDEQMVFVPDALNFKLNGLYWISKDKQFLQCVVESPQREQEGQPTATEQPATEATPTTGAAEQTGQMPEAAPSAENNTGSSETKPGESATPATPASNETAGREANRAQAPVASPVQEMKPAEARKATFIQARPAGAGAVIDQRPTARTKSAPADKGAAQSQPPIPSGDSGNATSAPEHHHGEATRESAPATVPFPSSIPPLKQSNEPPTPATSH